MKGVIAIENYSHKAIVVDVFNTDNISNPFIMFHGRVVKLAVVGKEESGLLSVSLKPVDCDFRHFTDEGFIVSSNTLNIDHKDVTFMDGYIRVNIYYSLMIENFDLTFSIT